MDVTSTMGAAALVRKYLESDDGHDLLAEMVKMAAELLMDAGTPVRTPLLTSCPAHPEDQTSAGDPVDLSLRFTWTAVDHVTFDGERPRFPLVPPSPGVHRFDLTSVESSPTRYIGDSANLARRMQNYRSPGPTQPTNLRTNAKVRETPDVSDPALPAMGHAARRTA